MRILFLAATGMLLAGCLLRPTTVSTRRFVLASLATNEPAATATQPLSVGIGFVKMPSYLLNSSMALRSGYEIEYVDGALWAERLDYGFQRALAANLSRLLSSDSIYLTDWAPGQVTVRVLIHVQQFDVDAHGRGTLIAHWRIIGPTGDIPLKSGHAHLDRTGASPRGNPEIIATTLSDLTAAFSRDLAHLIMESRPEHQVSNGVR